MASRTAAIDHDVDSERRSPAGKGARPDVSALDEAFLFAQSIDATSYERQRDRLHE
jgi:hypothetical protein